MVTGSVGSLSTWLPARVPEVVPAHQAGKDAGALHVDGVSHRGIELARFERAIADAVEHSAKAEPLEQRPHAVRVLGILRDEAGADEPPGLPRPDADDLAGIFALEVVKGVISGHAGDAGDEHRQAIAQHHDMISVSA